MSYVADMGGNTPTPSEVQKHERERIDQIADMLGLEPIPESRIAALSLGVAWGTERAYALADILAELADRGGERETYAQKSDELVLTDLDQDSLRQAREELADPSVGVTLGDEVDCDFSDPHADADPAEHTIPYGWIRTVADAHYGGRVPQVLQDMQLVPRELAEFDRAQTHATAVLWEIDRFQHRRGHCPGIFTERLQAVNSYLQQLENEEGDDASTS
jgi:hypothetical protein